MSGTLHPNLIAFANLIQQMQNGWGLAAAIPVQQMAPMPVAQSAEPDPNDYTARFNTQLTPAEEMQYQAWAKANNKGNDTYDYDLRGAWKNGAVFSPNGHLPDTFKKPNHPTFSDQSQYHGQEGYQGGTWGGGNGQPFTFTPGATNLQMMPAQQLQQYFQKYEPDVRLMLPQGQP